MVRPNISNSSLPAILYARGGSKEFGIIDDKQLLLIMSRLASSGFLVVGTQYSGNDGSDVKDELSGCDLEDFLTLKEVVNELGGDVDRITAYGASRGGLMVLNACRTVDWIKNAIISCPELDLIDQYKKRPELKEFRSDMYSVESEEENKMRSPFYHVEKLNKKTKYLLFQGGKDENVSPSKTFEFVENMNRQGLETEFHFYSNDGHALKVNYKDIFAITDKFLEKNCK